MPNTQLDNVIADIQATFGDWGPETSLDDMRKGWDALFAGVQSVVGATAEPVSAGGVRSEWIVAPEAREDKVILYFHGGGYVLGSIDSHRDMCERLSKEAKARVLIIDYRLAPENPFPAAVEDATSSYRWLLEEGFRPENIALAGDSAGGGLTFATLVSLRDSGVPLPACATPLSPWVDLEGTGESMLTKAEEDPMVQREMIQEMGQTYIAGGDLHNPLAAPLYADLAGLPPLLIQVGSRETLIDDSIRMAEKATDAGVEVTLDIWKGQIHVWQIFANCLDEGQRAIEKLGGFIRRHIKSD